MVSHKKSKSMVVAPKPRSSIDDISSTQKSQIEKFRKMQDKNNQKFLMDEPDQNFNLVDNLEMYIKLQASEDQ